MAVKPTNIEEPKPSVYAFLPLLLGIAPTLTVSGLHMLLADPKSSTWLGYLTVGAGIFILGYVAVVIFGKQVQLEKRLDELERLKN